MSAFVRTRPVISYFTLAYGISWLGASAVAAPYWLRGETAPKMAGLAMFPVMLPGPAIAGIVMTRITAGRRGWRSLFAPMLTTGPAQWLAVLALPPPLVIALLMVLQHFVSPVFTPNRFLAGLSFGLAAGFIEEIGWTGFAFPAMRAERSSVAAAILLGLLWGLWHLPVIDYLGAATPHGHYLLSFFLAFIAAMTAMRVVICWVVANTGSLLMAQLLHASSTGALVAFSPATISAADEAFWYAVYALMLWILVVLVVARFGGGLARQPRDSRSAAVGL
ncbi:MAG TPA: CPBP family glutamic-type intramembrane protease [Bryobacteraceae bacterium]|nr:CPBP family glutamic-type intramembrane protease [Bryobacteraceae bacterium]